MEARSTCRVASRNRSHDVSKTGGWLCVARGGFARLRDRQSIRCGGADTARRRIAGRCGRGQRVGGRGRWRGHRGHERGGRNRRIRRGRGGSGGWSGRRGLCGRRRHAERVPRRTVHGDRRERRDPGVRAGQRWADPVSEQDRDCRVGTLDRRARHHGQRGRRSDRARLRIRPEHELGHLDGDGEESGWQCAFGNWRQRRVQRLDDTFWRGLLPVQSDCGGRPLQSDLLWGGQLLNRVFLGGQRQYRHGSPRPAGQQPIWGGPRHSRRRWERLH
jgi:hypothetical protein